MQVRPARPGDVDAIVEVHVGSWRAAYAHVFGADRLATIDVGRRRVIAERMVAAKDSALFVAEDAGGRVVGFSSAGRSRDADAEAELHAIYVLPEAWGSGAGAALLRAAVEALRAAGHADAVLWVLEDNPRARRFYEREGWRPDGARKVETYLGVEVAEVRYRRAL